MLARFARFIKRMLVFLPGALVTYYVVRNIYPVLDNQIPAAPAVLLAYLLAAYVLIPALLRLARLIFPPSHVPHYSTTPDGFASDPIQIGLFGSRDQVINAMNKIGWFTADKRTLKTLLKLGLSLLLRKPYPTAPFSALYLLGRSQDLGFQLPVEGSPRHRHHVRFWPVQPAVAEHFQEDVAFWDKHHPDKNRRDDKILWLGAASLDTGLGLIRHNAQITHMIHPDTNAERELIVNSLKSAGLCKSIKKIAITNPYRLSNRVISGYLETDGNLTICQL